MIKVIETTYKGYRFRSRLEARWAVFFDHLGVKWVYEPEGFVGPDGLCYLPDFYLPETRGGVWVEIKPERDAKDLPAMQEAEAKLKLAMQSNARPGIIFCGEPAGNIELGERGGCELDWAGGWWMHFPDRAATQADVDTGWPKTIGEIIEGGEDGPYLFCTCRYCGKVGIEFDGRGDRVCGPTCCEQNGQKGDKGYSYDDPKIVKAAMAARSARFEHGQSGARA